MLVAILGVTLRGLLFAITGSCFVAEFSGYWLHRLLHSDKFPALSRGHLVHHFLIEREELLSLGSCSQALFPEHDSQAKA